MSVPSSIVLLTFSKFVRPHMNGIPEHTNEWAIITCLLCQVKRMHLVFGSVNCLLHAQRTIEHLSFNTTTLKINKIVEGNMRRVDSNDRVFYK